MALKFVSIEHGSISFTVDTPVNGDILLDADMQTQVELGIVCFVPPFIQDMFPVVYTQQSTAMVSTPTQGLTRTFRRFNFAPIDTSESVTFNPVEHLQRSQLTLD